MKNISMAESNELQPTAVGTWGGELGGGGIHSDANKNKRLSNIHLDLQKIKV
jgi:hypothetical protein